MRKKLLSSLVALIFSSTLYAIGLPHSATVLETMNSGGYSYIKVKEKGAGEVFWLAVKQTQVKQGQTFLYHEQMWMKDFTSKTLNRKFDKILFAKNASTNTKTIKKPTVKTEKTGPIIDIVNNRDSLNNTTVSIQGKVVKVSRGIMKTSWVHIEDTNKNRLIFRATKESVNIGDRVTATGTLNANVDYGYGYTFDAIVVNSTFH